MLLACMVCLMTMSWIDVVHGAETELVKVLKDGAKAEVVDATRVAVPVVVGASIFVDFTKEGHVNISHLGGKIVITYSVSDSPEPDSKIIEKAIYALKKHKDLVKEAEKQGPLNQVKDVGKETEQKYKSSANIPKSGITWEQMLVLRDKPHISAPFPDPNFVWTCESAKTCSSGTCKF